MTEAQGEVGPTRRDVVFRHDINALRAWAVLAVVGYHFNMFGFASGFAGVDVFFVISGYLITGQVLSQLENNRFSFLNFWTSRLRRIFPALCVVTVSAVFLGWWLTMPGEYLRHTREALSAVAFVSNVAYGGERGYFDAAAHTKPLLHSWSLSIEWQFYLLLPLLLGALWRISPATRKQSNTLAGLAFFTLASMAWCFWLGLVGTDATFFSLWARAWELLIGGMIAGVHQLSMHDKAETRFWVDLQRWRGLAGAIGWVLVGLSLVSGFSSSHWPGLLTLFPVMGSALIVWGGPNTSLDRWTNSTPLQLIGDGSFSIYLWHWPVWVFMQQWASYHGMPVEAIHKLGLLAVSFGLGYLSYRYVEQPIRWRRKLWTSKRLWIGYGLALTGLVAFTLVTVRTQGFPRRVPQYQQRAELARRTNTPRDECFRDSKSEKQVPTQFCGFGGPFAPQMPKVLLWGDSHANQYLEPLSSAASHLNLPGLIATQSGCRAFLVSRPEEGNGFSGCQRFNQEVFGFLSQDRGPEIVVIGRFWGTSASGVGETMTLIRQLLTAGKTVVLILPLPYPGFDVPDRWIREQFRAGKAIDELRVAATPEVLQQEVRDEIVKQTREFARNPRFLTVDPLPKICAESSCYLVRDGYANFRDTAHISNVNASQYEDIFATVLRNAVIASRIGSGTLP